MTYRSNGCRFTYIYAPDLTTLVNLCKPVHALFAVEGAQPALLFLF